MPLTLTPLRGIPLVKPGDSLVDLIINSLPGNDGLQIQDGDILVIAQKVISKAEGRLVNLTTVQPSPRAFDLAEKTQKDPRFIEMVLQESSEVLRTRPGTIIVQHKLGFVCANAGIDHSNVEGSWGSADDWILLLPIDPDRSAAEIRDGILSRTGKNIGVLIIDSHGRAWRMGTVGVAIGVAGLPALVDMRGMQDMFGYTLRVTMVAAADELAAGASLVMGQAAEKTPVVHVRGFPFPLREASLQELIRPRDMDLFR